MATETANVTDVVQVVLVRGIFQPDGKVDDGEQVSGPINDKDKEMDLLKQKKKHRHGGLLLRPAQPVAKEHP